MYRRILAKNKLLNELCRRHKSTIHNDPNSLKSKYDVVIIGAGHNGLVAANYLAKYTRKPIKICILERRDVVGGAAVTEEIVPGFKFSRASYLYSLFRPRIIQDLDLMRHGMIKFYLRDPSSYTPLLETDVQYSAGATSLSLSSDVKFNRQQISKFSRKDAAAYEEYEKWLGNICSLIEPFIDQPPVSLKRLKEKRGLLSKFKYIKSYIGNYARIKGLADTYEDIYRLFTESGANLLDEWFESDVLKATLATDSVIGAMLSPYSVGSAYVLLHHVIGGVNEQKGAWAYLEGGMGSLSQCLAVNAKSFGDKIEIHLQQEVAQIKLDQNLRSQGVLLKNGKFIEAEYVLSNCTPHVTFERLLDNYKLAEHENKQISNYFRRMKNLNYESGTMKINLAVDRVPNFKADPNTGDNRPMPHHRATIHINCENMKILDEAYQEAKLKNVPSSKPMIEMVIPSSLDPTISPKGSHVILLFCQYFPMDRMNNAVSKQKYAQLVFDSIEQYAPGFKNSIIGMDILTPFDLENVFGLTGGNIFHGTVSLDQLYINRPASGWSNYSTPIENLYLAGSGAHPGGGVMGSAGRLAALECISKINKSH